MGKVAVIATGESLGVILPDEILDCLQVKEGFIFLTESPEGFHITPCDPEFKEDMALARKVMRERRDLLRELAE